MTYMQWPRDNGAGGIAEWPLCFHGKHKDTELPRIRNYPSYLTHTHTKVMRLHG